MHIDRLLHARRLEQIICNEIITKCDHADNQFGFREGLGVQNAHATLLAILERHEKSKSNLYVYAIDISKAFDYILLFQAILSLFRSGVNAFVSLPVAVVSELLNTDKFARYC